MLKERLARVKSSALLIETVRKVKNAAQMDVATFA